jgi:hypothetical protein
MEEDAYYRQTLRRETYVEVKIIPELLGCSGIISYFCSRKS